MWKPQTVTPTFANDVMLIAFRNPIINKIWSCHLRRNEVYLYNEQCKTRVLIGLEECVIRV